MGSHTDKLIDYLRSEHPQFSRGLQDAATAGDGRFEPIAEMFLGWAGAVLGAGSVERIAEAFVKLTYHVNLAQIRYEAAGRYESRSFAEVQASHYSQDEQMSEYLWGVYAANFLWAHHVELCLQYHDRFLRRLPRGAHIVEIAPGPGGWGLWALKTVPDATVSGFDISPSSIAIATAMAAAAGVSDRAQYEERDALSLGDLEEDSADAVISCFLLEHLEEPRKVFDVVRHVLRPHGRAFVTGALTAAQLDHIYEFRRESDLVTMAEASHLRVVETFSANPPRLLPKAGFIPRSMSLLLEPARGSVWNA